MRHQNRKVQRRGSIDRKHIHDDVGLCIMPGPQPQPHIVCCISELVLLNSHRRSAQHFIFIIICGLVNLQDWMRHVFCITIKNIENQHWPRRGLCWTGGCILMGWCWYKCIVHKLTTVNLRQNSIKRSAPLFRGNDNWTRGQFKGHINECRAHPQHCTGVKATNNAQWINCSVRSSFRCSMSNGQPLIRMTTDHWPMPTNGH